MMKLLLIFCLMTLVASHMGCDWCKCRGRRRCECRGCPTSYTCNEDDGLCYSDTGNNAPRCETHRDCDYLNGFLCIKRLCLPYP